LKIPACIKSFVDVDYRDLQRAAFSGDEKRFEEITKRLLENPHQTPNREKIDRL
jgi:hypothetical protein